MAGTQESGSQVDRGPQIRSADLGSDVPKLAGIQAPAFPPAWMFELLKRLLNFVKAQSKMSCIIASRPTAKITGTSKLRNEFEPLSAAVDAGVPEMAKCHQKGGWLGAKRVTFFFPSPMICIDIRGQLKVGGRATEEAKHDPVCHYRAMLSFLEYPFLQLLQLHVDYRLSSLITTTTSTTASQAASGPEKLPASALSSPPRPIHRQLSLKTKASEPNPQSPRFERV